MFNHSAADANKTLEAPLRYPGATPDAERAHWQSDKPMATRLAGRARIIRSAAKQKTRPFLSLSCFVSAGRSQKWRF
jgi:hypothetical protein